MSRIKQSIIRRRKKRETLSLDDNDIDHRVKDMKLTRTSSFVSREVLLHHAVTNENLNGVLKVLEGDVDVNHMRPPGIAPLHIACVAGNIKFVTALTEKGADVHLKTKLGLSPLKLAFLFGHYDVAEHLISQGSDANEIKDGVQYDTPDNSKYAHRKVIADMKVA